MLDKDGLASLLNALHPDLERASHEYQALRERLLRFFEWNRTDTADELADEVLDRLARRLATKEEDIREPARYATGIARLLLQEYWRKKNRTEAALSALAQQTEEAERIERDRVQWEERAEILERCMQSIPEASRQLIRSYYGAESGGYGDLRQRLAEEYGITPNALRNRAMRIRMELERQVLRLQKEESLKPGKIHREK
jgi:RNA polymerase sigma factor (sigma-70 family)